MIGYVTIGTTDMEKSKAFWLELLEPLGAKILMQDDRMRFYGTGPGAPILAICIPYDKQTATQGNGTMVALAAGSRENADKLYAKAIELGATSEGEPGERMPGFYGGYFRDFDGNKLVAFHMG